MPPTPRTARVCFSRRLHPSVLFVLDASFWISLPGIFLFFYVAHFSFPKDAITAHYHIFFLGWISLVSLRILTYIILPRKVALILSSTLLAATAIAVVSFYILIVLALSLWGNVPTADLVAPYLRDNAALLETLGIPRLAFFSATALVFLSFYVSCHLFSAHLDWIPRLVESRLNPILPIVAISLVAGVSIKIYEYSIDPPGAQAEPLSLVIFPSAAQTAFQTHGVAKFNSPASRQEDESRAAFVASEPTKRRNVILIVVDALRPDRMSTYGYHRQTAPTLDRELKLEESAKIEHTYAVCAESLCGIYAILNSRFPHQMVARPFGLSDVLRTHGYKVTFLLSGDHTNFYNLKEVYGQADHFYDSSHTNTYRLNDDQLVIDQVRQMPKWDGSPQMLHFHLMSSHGLGRRLDRHKKWLPEANYTSVGSREPNRVDNFYDNGVRQTDWVIGEILDSLQTKGYLSEALVVVTADHGEALGEHDFFLHSNSVYEPMLRIPLLLISYGDEGRLSVSNDQIASQVDIAPTILSHLGVKPPAIWEGSALQQYANSRVIRFQQGAERGLIEARPNGELWKYWKNARTSQEYVFDLHSDPGETHNLINQVPTALVLDWRKTSATPTLLQRPAPPR
jgi:glucan phosphoethanolaminetransferase (alkaline phosphatase superfamily)